MPIRETARAKVNLTLKVLGRRPDGYHELESVVTFADVGDRLELLPRARSRIAATGPFAAEITGENLLTKTLALLRELEPRLQLGSVRLEKNLPVAAGLGGGSADAAALLRAVRQANPVLAPGLDWQAAAARLGADVPVCLVGRPALMWGKGDRLQTLAEAPLQFAVVLANPRQPLATAEVFAALAAGPAPAIRSQPAPPRPFRHLPALVDYIRARGNDLEAPATRLMPAIAEMKAALAAQPGCHAAAMSGSGPTCFGVFMNEADTARAASALTKVQPGWWIVATRLDLPG